MEIPKRKRSVIAFTDALCRLVSDTPIKKITVTAICEEAGYTSMAFYSNFENKNDFVTSVVDYEAQVFAACVYERLEQKDGIGRSTKNLHSLYLTDYFEHVAANRTLYLSILSNLIVPDGISLLSRRIAHYMSPYLTLLADGGPEMPNFSTFVIEITEAQMLMVIRYWLWKMPDMEPRAAAALYCDRFLFRRTAPIEQDAESGGYFAKV